MGRNGAAAPRLKRSHALDQSAPSDPGLTGSGCATYVPFEEWSREESNLCAPGFNRMLYRLSYRTRLLLAAQDLFEIVMQLGKCILEGALQALANLRDGALYASRLVA